MATGDHPSFDSVLKKVLDGNQRIGVLFNHPTFQRRATRICTYLAGRESGEDLLQDIYTKLLRYLVVPDPDCMQNEQQFNSWFYKVACNTYKDRMTKQDQCTDSGREWPDSTDDVPQNRLDEFLDHAALCPYHSEILLAEDEENDERLRVIFRQARGLDRHGRLLKGAELRTALTDHERRLKTWHEATLKNEFFFYQILVYNGDREILSCGKFFNFSKHVSLHDLDPTAGLQIRGKSLQNTNEDVLLGAYALVGVRHHLSERVLHLANGYTVGLKVEGLSARSFEVQFRCIATKTFLQEALSGLDPEDKKPEVVFDDAHPQGSSALLAPQWSPPLHGDDPSGASVWITHFITSQLAPAGTLCGLVLLLIMGVTAGVLVGKNSGPIAGAPAAKPSSEVSAANSGEKLNSTGFAGAAPSKPNRRSEESSAANGNNPTPVLVPLPLDQGHTPTPGESESSKGIAPMLPNAPDIAATKEAAKTLQSEPLGVQGTLYRINGGPLSQPWAILGPNFRFVGSDPVLQTVLERRLGGLGINVKTVAMSDSSPAAFILEWSVIPISGGTAPVNANLVAIIKDAQGHRLSAVSLMAQGGNQDEAYSVAVQKLLPELSYTINLHPDHSPRQGVASTVEPNLPEHPNGMTAANGKSGARECGF
ncbi:MAG TPA: hypothetical protein VGN90_01630 [Pyrinomonadaceae bacterium]|nr:hypothetical protein [Pyrinomonadaceae bacterium]